ncbi:DUF440 family protein [Providencia rustigianii]|uniref:HI1450 family dsDNA-mimic protein n=1 Tax=Providencia rustigianii TaxID=158850 RepID=UPI000F6CFE72|nr:HI1450 family dsDNA-mimic protein [Providencia rustigianii]MTC59093.1 DUF440 family protein [Providencia rustigianii]VEH55572.1 dsDNA-mimic protein [Providencia rustigianii]
MSHTPNINLIDEDEIIEIAYDLFLEGAMDNLEPADQVIFALQFEECGAAEVVPFSQNWHILATQSLPLEQMSEIIIGLAKSPEDDIEDIFARILISRNPQHPFQHIEWKQ